MQKLFYMCTLYSGTVQCNNSQVIDCVDAILLLTVYIANDTE